MELRRGHQTDSKVKIWAMLHFFRLIVLELASKRFDLVLFFALGSCIAECCCLDNQVTRMHSVPKQLDQRKMNFTIELNWANPWTPSNKHQTQTMQLRCCYLISFDGHTSKKTKISLFLGGSWTLGIKNIVQRWSRSPAMNGWDSLRLLLWCGSNP